MPQILIRCAATALLAGAGAIAIASLKDELDTTRIVRQGIALSEVSTMTRSDRPSYLLFAAADALDPHVETERRLGIELLQAGLDKSPHHSGALARLAYLQTLEDGRFSRQAAETLSKSISECGYCDRDLIRWRLQFVLQNWQDTPEQLRISVVEGADFLRWWHADHEFLADAHAFARAELIPFKQYQSAVGSPIRPHELPDE